MKTRKLSVLLVPLLLLVASCAPPMQPPMQPLPKNATSATANNFEPKVSNFEIVIDTSLSMEENGPDFLTARDIVRRINEGIPDGLNYTAGLRSLGHSGYQSEVPTTLLYGMDNYQKLAYHNALNSIRYVGGPTPMATTIRAAGADLSSLKGKSALIIVSDGLHMNDAPAAAQSIKEAAGDNLCIYTITVGNNLNIGPKTMSKIADAGGCGFATSATDLKNNSQMADFINKVFISEVKDSDQDGVLNNLDQCPGTPKGVSVDTKGCPLDADRDGVPDYLDKCPNTPLQVKVDTAGCPIDSDKDGVADYLDKCPNTPTGIAVNKNGCPVDSDADGVADYLDKCPNTPKGAPVDKQGCPLDSDKDGVADYLDQCPNTPAGVSIDKDGCPTRLTLRIKFDNNSSQVSPVYHDELSEAAQCIKDYPGNEVLIYGHTDSKGAATYNQKLSENRASAVRNSLISQFDIAEKKLKIRGFGEDLPVADNKTSEGRALNRRVEVLCGAAK